MADILCWDVGAASHVCYSGVLGQHEQPGLLLRDGLDWYLLRHHQAIRHRGMFLRTSLRTSPRLLHRTVVELFPAYIESARTKKRLSSKSYNIRCCLLLRLLGSVTIGQACLLQIQRMVLTVSIFLSQHPARASAISAFIIRQASQDAQ